MSVICQTFVQNAWRSDLCSNCFKCLAEHSDSRNNKDRMSTPRYMPQATSIYQSRGISSTLKWRLSEPIYERIARRDFGSQTPPKANQETDNSNSRGILIKDTTQDKRLRSRSSVDFASEEALVIGYGGNDYDSDQSPWEMASDDESIDLDLLDDTDEDRKISRLTKNNTEFNSSNKNLVPEDTKVDKLNSINNNVNNNNKNTSTPTKQQPLTCVTYNDIQPQKKLNQYYFSTNIEPLKSYLHNNNNNDKDKPNNDDIVKADNDTAKVDNVRKADDNCRNLLSSDFTPTKQQPLTCVTYNDIQPQKKLNQYYFSTNIEPLKSYLHNNNNNDKDKPNNDDIVKADNDTAKVDNVRKADDNCRNLLSSDFTPLNTRTYSFVSELNKNGVVSEQSSDSDYSTCRLTTGDSTDSESFQDAEEPRILPCSSFLHGSFPRKLQQQPSMNSLDSDKQYDGGSSTSGDVSNLSDDSDTVESSERTFKSRTTRSTTSSLADSKRSSVVHDTKSPPPSPDQSVSSRKPDVAVGTPTTKAPSPPNPKKAPANPPPNKMDTPKCDMKGESKPGRKEGGIVSEVAQAIPNKPINIPPPNPNPPVEINLRNIIAVNERVVETEKPVTPSVPKSSPPRSVKSSDASQKNVRKPAPVKEKIYSTPSMDGSPTSTPKQVSIDKPPSDDDEGSPEAINNRQSKLAALALELELARRDSEIKSGKAPPPPSLPPPEVKAKCSVPRSVPNNPNESFSTIKKGGGISCTSRLTALPDVLQESSSPAKLKKNRFSLKKLLKRNKDSGIFAPAGKEVNPKAWKKQTFDRNRLSLEIVHPMDLTPPTSGDSTPTEEGQYSVSTNPGRGALRGGYNRARSLSALPQLGTEYQDPTLLDCRKVDTMPTRKAGTVAERKKNRPSLVRTPSCSALPNRPSAPVQDRTPPPKPPPPPKCMQPPPPPPPPHQHRKPPSCSPARPPPPKIPETKSRIPSGDSSKTEQRDSSNLDKEYANLGDIRSLMTPKKPQRPSAVSVSRDSREGNSKRRPDEFYETLQATEEEEDHYTYLDDTEGKSPKNPVTSSTTTKEYPPSPKRNAPVSVRPWLDLQTSYAAIAAANYESLAEIITTSMSEGTELFQNGSKSLRWKDFTIDEDEPQTVAGNRTIYSATYKLKGNKILLMVTPKQQSSPQNTRNQVRYPVLASFSDCTPVTDTWASVYVLHPARVFSVGQFPTRASGQPSHLHLRDTCFVLLQLIHTLKSLQAEGIEDLHWDLDRLLLIATAEDRPPVFVLFPEDKTVVTQSESSSSPRRTLCQATLSALLHLLQIAQAEDLGSCLVNGERLADPVAHTFRAIAEVLGEEKASSLSQAKGFLEYMLWGPVDLKVDGGAGVDGVVQRWLDLQRAQMVKSTIAGMQQRNHLHVYEEYQLVFLLQASVKSLKSVISKL